LGYHPKVLQRKALPFLKAVAARLAFNRRAQDPSPRSALARLDTSRWNHQLLKHMEWRRFEEVCVAYYEALGIKTRIRHTGTEGGVDILLYETREDEPRALARCKAWEAFRVGIKPVRALRRAMAETGIRRGVLLTAGRFSQEAADEAKRDAIELVDGAKLLERIAALPEDKARGLLEFATEGDFLTPTCPHCSIKMVPRRSTKDSWPHWGCRNYPACKKTFAGTPFAPD